MLFDLAGHHQYYSSHCAALEAISLTPSTFLMLVNMLQNLKDITAQLYYWSAMIGDVCHKCLQDTSVIVVGTHVDGIADKRKLESLQKDINMVARKTLSKHTFVGFTALNATDLQGKKMKSFMSSLRQTNSSVIAKHPAISLNSHMMYAFLNDRVPARLDAIPLSQLLTILRQEEPKFLPTEASEVTPLLKTLSDKGLIVFLCDDEANSWIVLHPEALLEKVNGVLFAPESLEEHLPIASSTGVIPIPVLRDHFHDNTDMMVQFLKLFELCVPITLTNVNTNMAPIGSPNTPSTAVGPLLYFPACVLVEKPSNVTITQRGFGWLLRTTSINQSFSPRCLHVITTRLADGFALLDQPCLVPELDKYNRRCDVWIKGISWMNEEGVHTVFEMANDFRCLSCTTSEESNPQYTLSVMKVIKEACNEFCPSVSVVELISCPPEATSDNTPAEVKLELLTEIVRNKKNKVVSTKNMQTVNVSKWKKAEPQLLEFIGMKEAGK